MCVEMNTEKQRIIKIIKSFIDINAGDEATMMMIFAIGCEILNVSENKLVEMIEGINNDQS